LGRDELRKKLLNGASAVTPDRSFANPFEKRAYLFDDPDPKTGDFAYTQFSVNLPSRALTSTERGLIVAPPVREVPDGAVQIGGVLDPQEIRFALLLWDHLRYPQSNLVHVGPGPDEQYLASAGVLDYAKINFHGLANERAILATQKLGFLAQDSKEPGRWSLGKGDGSLSFSDDELKVGQGILLTLHKVIPIPNEDVPLAELLEFKSKRRDELLALRHHLERLYQQIIDSPDVHQSLATELSALDAALKDQLKASCEEKFKWRLSDLNAKVGYKVDWKTWAAGAGAYATASTGLPLAGAVLAGLAGAAAVTFNVSGSIARKKPTATPFEYVSRFHTELFNQ
jgi:hypothetical protein